MPSVTDSMFVAMLCALLCTTESVRLLGDAGIGWHIRTGQWILAHQSIPHVDLFSSTMAGKAWFAWEWLYDWLAGRLDSALGLNGVVWLTAVVIAAVFAWTFRLLIRRRTHFFVALALYLLAMSASAIHFLARPHVVSWLFTLAWFYVLDLAELESPELKRRLNWLWFLPLLMVVWVNVHGGFVVGFVLLGIFWLSAVIAWLGTSETRLEEVFARISARKRARDYLLVGALSGAASLVNPYGWKLHAHVFSYLSNRFIMDHVDEFRSPDFHQLAPRCFLLLVLLTLIALSRARQLRLSELLTLIFAVATGLMSSRNLPVSSLLMVIIIGPLLSRGWTRSSPATGPTFAERITALEVRMRGHWWPMLAVVVTFWIAFQSSRAGSSHLVDAHFDPKRMPVAAANYLYEHGMNPLAEYSGPTCDGPVLAPDYWGGYLIYRLNWPVVVDDRHDLYGSEFFKFYLRFVRGEPGWQDFLRAHKAGCILVPKDSTLNSLLAATPEWKLFYADDVAVVFLPLKESPTSRLQVR